jgi:hypothetical protein
VPAAMRLLVGAVVAGAGSWLCDMGFSTTAGIRR